MKLIHSRDNLLYKGMLKLARSSRERKSEGSMLLDGDHLIESCISAGLSVSAIAIGESAYDLTQKRRIFDAASCPDKYLFADHLLAGLSPMATSQGLIALAPIPSAGDFPKQSESCLLLERIQDPGNLGTMLRTAAAAGIRHVALSDDSATAWSPKVLRAGMGAHFCLHIHQNQDLVTLARGFEGTRIATAPKAMATLYAVALDRAVAWIFGSEGSGISQDLLACADHVISIPMPGAMESLNVASALAICLFEQVRRAPASLPQLKGQ